MWEKLQPGEIAFEALRSPKFIADEVKMNLLHRICEMSQSVCYSYAGGAAIFAGSPGHNAWLWMEEGIREDERQLMLKGLVKLAGHTLRGITAEPRHAKLFAELYAMRYRMRPEYKMGMEAYYCPSIVYPSAVEGTLRQTVSSDAPLIAEFMAGFAESAYGYKVHPASQIPSAENTIATGNLYIWTVNEIPVSMAHIAHRSPRHARINYVYTPSYLRKRGYASATVAACCGLIVRENRVPMLYADLTNPDSNKVYQNIGFVESGKVADVKFVS
ncbi:N-acetyltransferase [Paenibacillus glycanilyticus]|uniref:N-acetyltransferase n=2 Tax=Paenibacillus glycanilyticus TaxID=126569 RepID=A0ABQ6GH03_9BACL|nr:N-acetyltransferase [Paenibacillus glycanilyticus]